MNIEKLPSGSYRVTQMYKGKRYRVTFDHKPTKQEQLEAFANMPMQSNDVIGKGSFELYARRYISIKENVLSPSTVRVYTQTLNSFTSSFRQKDISKITASDIQIEINLYSSNHQPKTVRNMHGFISAVFKMFRPSFQWSVTLPQKVISDKYIPTSEDIRSVLALAKGSIYEIPLRLGCYGLRRSEVLSVTAASLNGSELTIDKATVLNKDNQYVEKTTKTTNSTRTIYIDNELADMIKAQGQAYVHSANSIIKALHRFQDEAGVPRFTFHALRHYFATELSGKVSDEDIMYLGGWSSDFVMKKVYRHARADKDKKIRKNIQELLAKNLHAQE